MFIELLEVLVMKHEDAQEPSLSLSIWKCKGHKILIKLLLHCFHILIDRFALTLGECGEGHCNADVACRYSVEVDHILVGGAYGCRFNLVLLNLRAK